MNGQMWSYVNVAEFQRPLWSFSSALNKESRNHFHKLVFAFPTVHKFKKNLWDPQGHFSVNRSVLHLRYHSQTSSAHSLLPFLRRHVCVWSCYRPGVAQRVGRGIALLFHDRGTRRGKWSSARPGRTSPPGKTRYPFYRRLGGLQGRSGRAENLVPTGIRSRTVKPVVSRYTDWAIRPTLM